MDSKKLTDIEKEENDNIKTKFSTLIRYGDGLKQNGNRNYDFNKALVLSSNNEDVLYLTNDSKYEKIPTEGIFFDSDQKDTLIIIGKDKVRSYHSDEGFRKIQVEEEQIKVYEHGEELPTYLNLNGKKSAANYDFIINLL